MRRLIRLTVLSFLCTVLVVMAGALRENLNARAAVPPRVIAAGTGAGIAPLLAAQVPALTSSPAVLVTPASAVVSLPKASPAGAENAVLADERVDDGSPWSPPLWFPDDQAEALLALEQISRAPDRVGPKLGLKSKSVFVFDLESGEVLLSKNADDRRPVASLTKVVSSLTVASEGPDLDEEVCIDVSAKPGWPGAVTRLRSGTCTTGWDLLAAAMVKSDNGAAYALSSVAGLPHYPFVARMNVVASELGMDQSTFSDPSGAEDDNLSTARDMTRAIVAASLHPALVPVAGASYWDMYDATNDRVRRLYTTNKLHDRSNTEVLAAKTGYTDTARYCFTAVFRTRNGRKVAMTVLGGYRSRHRWSDVRAILDWVESGAPGAGVPS